MNSLQIAQKKIQQGEVIAYPTEAIYGLGCNPLDEKAVAHLLNLKSRSVKQGLILVAGSLETLDAWVDLTNPQWKAEVSKSWQDKSRAVTWLIPKKDICPTWISGEHATLAVRFTHHPLVKQLAQVGGVLVSTSANPHGKAPAKTCDEVTSYFGNEVFCLAGELGGLNQPSEIWDAQTLTRIR